MRSNRERCLTRVNCLAGCLALALSSGGDAAAGSKPGTSIYETRLSPPYVADFDHRSVTLAPALREALVSQMRATMGRAPIRVPSNARRVTNCADNGTGSFRDAMLNAVNGDTIDLTNTGCSVVTLTTGSVTTSANDLILQGPGALALSINGNDLYSPVRHTGTGILAINDLTIERGSEYSDSSNPTFAKGGCVYSTGTVSLANTQIENCHVGSSSAMSGVKGAGVYGRLGVTLSSSIVSGNEAEAQQSYAYGGGVYTQGAFSAIRSLIIGNTVNAPRSFQFAQGAGVEVGCIGYGANHVPGGSAFISYSSIVDNVASSPSASSIGGGLYLTGDVLIQNSTIASNHAAYGGGGLFAPGENVTQPFEVVSSTISGNSGMLGAGLDVTRDINIFGSTIADNATIFFTSNYGAGLSLFFSSATLQSTIVYGNTTDEGSGPQPDDVGGNSQLSGTNNIVGFSNITVPSDTISADPMLDPLADNGGATVTQAITSDSPAYNSGNDVAGVAFDQRGAGFPRVAGPAADIGAFEVQATASAPIIAKMFTPDSINPGGSSTVTITLSNSNSTADTLTATLVDALPKNVVIADTPNTATTCPNGIVNASPGSDSVRLDASAQIPANGACTVSVDVTGSTEGLFTNTIAAGDLQTDSGSNLEAASAELTVVQPLAAPTITKVFAPDNIEVGGRSTLTITLGNPNATVSTLTADLIDNLPSPAVIADPANASTTCPGGTVSAATTDGIVNLSAGAQIPPGTSCTLTVDVTSQAPATVINVIGVGDLQTDFGANIAPAKAPLIVRDQLGDTIFANGFESI